MALLRKLQCINPNMNTDMGGEMYVNTNTNTYVNTNVNLSSKLGANRHFRGPEGDRRGVGQRQMSTSSHRWTQPQAPLGGGGRSGALSVTLRAALKVRARKLNEVETWAVLCQAGQALQDVLLQLAGASLAGLELLLVSADTLRLTTEGRAEVERSRGAHLGELLHPEVGSIGRLSLADIERLAVFSLGRTLSSAASNGLRSVQPLLAAMCSHQLSTVPRLLEVLSEVERHWRQEVGASPPSQLVAQLCHLTLGRAPAPQSQPTQFHRLNCSSSSDSTDDLHSSSSSSLPKPPQGMPGIASPLRSSMPDLLEGQGTQRMFTQHRKYGKRLEFKPAVAQMMEKQKEEKLERARSRSASSLPGLRQLPGDHKISKRSVANARRLYREEPTGGVVGPEFVVRSSAPPIRADLTSGSSRGTTVLLVLLTGHKLEVRLEPASTSVQQLAEAAQAHLCLGSDGHRLGLMVHSCGEWLHLAPSTRLAKLIKGGREGQTALTLHHRFLLLPTTLEQLSCSAAKHLLYLQLRQDVIDGLHRADVSLHLSLAGLALRAEFGAWGQGRHGTGPYFLPQHYLPDQVRTLLGERGARIAAEKQHCAQVEGIEGPEASFCNQVMRLRDYGFFFYTGRQGKKPESASSFFAIHTNGIFFFEISSNVFKPPKEIEKYNWRDIKEIQVGSAKIQFVLRSHDLGGGGGVSNSSRVKIYLDEWKARHVFDMAETYHAHHISCCTNNSPSDATPFENLPKIVKNDALNDVFRTFCKKVKRYTKENSSSGKSQKRLSLPLAGRIALKRTTSAAGDEASEEARYTIRRLTHYTSMATVAGPQAPPLEESPVHQTLAPPPGRRPGHLTVSDSRSTEQQTGVSNSKISLASTTRTSAPLSVSNCRTGKNQGGGNKKAPDKKYRYKLYLENEDDEVGAVMETGSVPGDNDEDDGDGFHQGKENQRPNNQVGSRRRTNSVRMGTRILTNRRNQEGVVPPLHHVDSGLNLPGLLVDSNDQAAKTNLADLHKEDFVDVSLRPTVFGDPMPEAVEQGMDESLSMSLLERFDAMETEAGEPERRIGTVVMQRDAKGRLGVKIGGAPSGVYVDRIDWDVASVVNGSLQEGDRVIGVDQQSLESLDYSAALQLLQKAGPTVTLLVSQLR